MQEVNGDRYVGVYVDDKKHGVGVWYDIGSQTKRQGTWNKGARVGWIGPASQTYVTQYGQQDNTDTEQIKLRKVQNELSHAQKRRRSTLTHVNGAMQTAKAFQ